MSVVAGVGIGVLLQQRAAFVETFFFRQEGGFDQGWKLGPSQFLLQLGEGREALLVLVGVEREQAAVEGEDAQIRRQQALEKR